MKSSLTVLGSGASLGVPMIGCACATCTSSDPHNKRSRSAALYQEGDKKLLIDAGPDFYSQAVRYGITQLNGLLITHTHYDHIAGIDELRVFTFKTKKALPVLLSEASFQELQRRYDYLIGSGQYSFTLLKEREGTIVFEGVELSYFTYTQAHMPVTGFRFGKIAYVTDIKDYDESIFHHLKGVETLVVSALRDTPSTVHLTVDDAIAFCERAGVKQSYFTHIAHEIEHTSTNSRLPQGMALAYDGLVIR